MRAREVSRGSLLAVALALCALLIGVLGAGAFDHGGGSSGAAVQLMHGVPVGVRDTPAGALAAGDDYLALSSQSIEQDPRMFAALLAQAYTPRARSAGAGGPPARRRSPERR